MLADDLAEALRVHPDRTAHELAELVAPTGSSYDEKVVARALYAAHDRFRGDSGNPVRWRLAGPTGPPPSSPAHRVTVGGSGDEQASPELYRWQRDALAAWVLQGRRGVIEAVTGAGKTLVGVAAVLDQRRARGQAAVLVPTKELQQQWLAVLRGWCGSTTLIGARGDGGRATLVSHDVIVAVVNSVRDGDLRPTRPGGLLVADECHRYGSEMNRLALDPRMTRRLGLSATYARDDDGHLVWLDPYFAGTCFRLGYQEAVADGVVAEPVVALVGISLQADERARYDEHTETIGQTAAQLVERYGVIGHPYSAFMREVNQLADRSTDSAASSAARRYRHAVLDRRRLLADARGKDERLDGLAPAVAAADRAIVFTQSIAASESAATLLRGRGISARAVHSGLPTERRRAALQQFADGELHALTAPRVLDEGFDVPTADLAVIVGASRTRRQMIQRMGRVLRVKTDGRCARFAIIYAEATVEDPVCGAHEGFLGEVTSIARAVRTFPSSTPADSVIAFLDGRRWIRR